MLNERSKYALTGAISPSDGVSQNFVYWVSRISDKLVIVWERKLSKMRARLVVFPIMGRNWCFSRSIDPSIVGSSSGQSSPATSPTLRDIWKSLSKPKPMGANAELVVDFASNKMNDAWTTLEKAPEGSIKNKIYGVGLLLLSRVKPAEIFLKSISKDVSEVEITYPTSLNERLVRRRVRHIALRGTQIHKKYMYGSAALLPFASALMVLPLPNVAFFWVLFRTYSHWRALQGSEKLLQLVSDSSVSQSESKEEEDETKVDVSSDGSHKAIGLACVLKPSKELDELLRHGATKDGLSESIISEICEGFYLNPQDVGRYKKSV